MNKICSLLFIALSVTCSNLYAQDTLPRFSVKNVGNNRIVVGWTNAFENISQISIQRSPDSLKNYKTILTVADPTTPQNGYVDTKAPNDKMFYRLYILLSGGTYLFSDAKRPVLDTSGKTVEDAVAAANPDVSTIFPGDTALVSPNTPGAVKPTGPPPYIPSKYVYTAVKDGNVQISLPGDDPSKYVIRFYTAEEELLFELKNLKEKSFKIEKSVFYKSGWYNFELIEDDKTIEKHKFFLRKEF
ncbi:hypothetical protein ACFS6H_10175 [Terrimonas rubra]|jgi:hypothetical protein|uniref:Uncharacterized protein n=1 Tax=Terrimonas rubra TaxID=1035890 RepID=A0ABW6A763_9BACT